MSDTPKYQATKHHARKSQDRKRVERKNSGQQKDTGPKPITQDWLERAALHYLGRFATNEARLREVLQQKIQRRAQSFDPLTEQQREWIEALVEKFIRLGYLDDTAYAAMKARSLLGRGKPVRTIERDLMARGLSRDDITDAIQSLGSSGGSALWEDGEGMDVAALDLEAAIRLAKRRRFGAFQPDPSRAKPREKQIAAMMRAGFSPGLAVKVIDAENPESLYADDV